MSLPAGWSIVPLGDVADTALGKMLDKGRSRGLPRVRYLRNVNVQWGRIDTDDVLEMELGDDERERFGVQKGDLLVCEGGEVGRAAIWERDGEYIAYQKALHRVRPRTGVDARYLRYALENAALSGAFKPFTTGSTIAHLPQQNLRRVPLPIPPFAEQRRIVEILEDHLSRLDAAQRGLNVTRLRVEKLRMSLYRATFARYADRTCPLSEAARIENGQTPKGLTESLVGTPNHDSVPFYKVGDMNGGDGRLMPEPRFYIDRRQASALGLHVRAPGLVLIPKRGGAIATNKKRVLDREAAFDLNTMGLRPAPGLSTEYLWRFLQGVDLGQIADGTAVPQINAKQIERVQIPVLDANEQERVLDELASAVDACDHLDREASRALTRASALRRSLLTAAFSGRLSGAAFDVVRTEDLAEVGA